MAKKSRKFVPLREIAPVLLRLGRSFWPEIRGQGSLVAASFFLVLLSIVARVFEPWPVKFIFDWVIMPVEQSAEALAPLGTLGPWIVGDTGTLVLALVVAIVLLTGARALFTYFSVVGMALAATRIVTAIRARMFSHLQKLSLGFHYRAKSGDLVTRFTYDMERLRDVSVTALLPLAANLLTVAALVAVMFWLNWELALLGFSVVPFFYAFTIRATESIQRVVREQRARDGAMAATAAESLMSIKFVQALSLGRYLEGAFSKQNVKSLKEGAKAQRLTAGLERKVEILLSLGTALVMWRGIYLVLDGVITPGTLLVFVTYLAFVFRPMRQVVKYLSKLARATASGERVLEVLETPLEIEDAPGAIEARDLRGRLTLEDVSFRYMDGKPALAGINLDVLPGEHIALVGPSGGGKSTLLSLFLRLHDPQHGRVLLDGRDVREYTVESLREQMSVVLQDSMLFAVSIRDNIAYGRLDATPAEVEEAARLANAHDFIMELPEGYDTILGERGATLSGGQLQRIAIARATIRRSPVMLLDEPTAGLDNVNRCDVNAALEQSTRGRTTLLVAHDLESVSSFDRILYVDGGRILESGSHAELMAMRGLYYRMYSHKANAEGQPAQPTVLAGLGVG